MITDELRYGFILAVALMFLFVIGNYNSSSQQTLSIFPWLVDLFVFPIILYPAIKAIGSKRHGTSLTVQKGLLIGEVITRWGAFLFAVVAAGYGYFCFGDYGPWLAAFGMAVIITWAMGLLVSLSCALIIVRRLPPGKSPTI